MKIRDKILPVLRPAGDHDEINALSDVIKSGWWGRGPKVEEFEEKFAKMVGAKHALAVTSASHGQDLVMKALGMKNIDVINPAQSFIATAMIPLWNGYSSNIVDVLPDTLCLDPNEIIKYKKPNSEILIAVNHAGVSADFKNIRKNFGGFIIEDTAHSCFTPGAGQGGDCAVWSFQAVKTMPCGDGGMITSNDEDLIRKCRDMTWFGVSSTWSRTKGINGKPGYTWDYDVNLIGYKYYMIDIMAAICIEQMKKLPKHLEFRRYIQKRYNLELNSQVERPPHSETVQYYCARVDESLRDNLIDYLAKKNIHTSVHFKPLYLYDPLIQDRSYPVMDKEWKKFISLPCHNAMKDEDIDYVIYWVNEFYNRL